MQSSSWQKNGIFWKQFVREWGLEAYASELFGICSLSERFSKTYESHPFRTLAFVLETVNERYKKIKGIEAFTFWVENGKELTERALRREIDLCPESRLLQQVLFWALQTGCF